MSFFFGIVIKNFLFVNFERRKEKYLTNQQKKKTFNIKIYAVVDDKVVVVIPFDSLIQLMIACPA